MKISLVGLVKLVKLLTYSSHIAKDVIETQLVLVLSSHGGKRFRSMGQCELLKLGDVQARVGMCKQFLGALIYTRKDKCAQPRFIRVFQGAEPTYVVEKGFIFSIQTFS